MTHHPALRSRASEILSWTGHVDRLLVVEAALAKAQAALGLIPAEAATAIVDACDRDVDRDELTTQATDAATAVIPLVGMLRQAVGGEGAPFVHHGATSQDIVDTALVLQLRDAIAVLLEELAALGDASAELANTHRSTVMAGRTLLQHAVPVTFGAKAAHWLSAVTRHVDRLHLARAGLPVQLGGAAGTLAPFGDRGIELLELFAAELGLTAPIMPWHTDRDVLHQPVVQVALTAGTLGKISGDLISLAQTEVGEIADPGAGGSSTMPHKRNPVDPVFAVASARLALGAAGALLPLALQEHERASGGWQAEWEAIPRIVDATVAAAERTRATVERIEVDDDRMRSNLDQTDGAVMAEAVTLALAPHTGRSVAVAIVSEAADQARTSTQRLGDVLRQDERVTEVLGDGLEEVLDPANYLGSIDAFIDRALGSWRSRVTAPQS